MARTLFTITGLLFLSVLLTDTNEAAPSTGTIQVAFILSEFEDQAYQDDHDQDYFDDLAFGENNSMSDYLKATGRLKVSELADKYKQNLTGDHEVYNNPDNLINNNNINNNNIRGSWRSNDNSINNNINTRSSTPVRSYSPPPSSNISRGSNVSSGGSSRGGNSRGKN